MKVEELRKIAKENKMPGAWKAKKSEMIAFLESIDYCQEAQNEPELTEESEIDKISVSEEKLIQEPSDDKELIAKKQLKVAYDKIVREYESALIDGDITKKDFNNWISEEAIDEVYHESSCEMSKEFCYSYLERLFKNDGYKNAVRRPQNELYGTLEVKLNNLSGKKENTPKQPQNASKLKSYAAWVVNRETKEITTTFGEADCREDFYNSIKTKYRVRLITKPEKLEEECKQWEIKHARNKQLKNEKYAADKVEAQKININVGEYRKWLRESAKSDK